MDTEKNFDEMFDEMFNMGTRQGMTQSQENKGYDVSDERLREMNKRLPSWNLEPPHSALK